MFCIAAFIVLFLCGIFSGAYRQMAKKAWHCVLRRVTFRPCDINFSEEVKGKLIGRLILTHPKAARFLDRWIDAFAWVFVTLSVWSLVVVAIAGLNLLVYDTCDPQNPEGCSLSGEACSVGAPTTGYFAKYRMLGDTISRVPARFQTWRPEDYITGDNTWYYPFDKAKPTALEIVDPGCSACAKLFANIRTANFESHYNLTYIAYPIPEKGTWSGYKFGSSYLVATYLEAMKLVPPASPTSTVAPDWRLLERVFSRQEDFDARYAPDQAREAIRGFSREFGYSDTQWETLRKTAESSEAAARIGAHRALVEQRIRTVKIPTILFGGRRYDRVITPDRMR